MMNSPVPANHDRSAPGMPSRVTEATAALARPGRYQDVTAKLAATSWVAHDVHLPGLAGGEYRVSGDACYRAMDWLIAVEAVEEGDLGGRPRVQRRDQGGTGVGLPPGEEAPPVRRRGRLHPGR
jgi:hypothetical protein